MVTALSTLKCSHPKLAWPGGPPLYSVHLETGEIEPVRCKRLACDHCLPYLAYKRSMAMAWMKPYRMVLFTAMAPPDDPKPVATARIRMKRLRQTLLRKGVDGGQWAWTLEKNPNETGFHAHAVQHGPYVRQAHLGDAADSAGSGIVFIQKSRTIADDIVRYATKGFGSVSYGLKTFKDRELAHEALTINGGRIEHHTRDYYQYDGHRIAVRKAEEYAHIESRGDNCEPTKIGTGEELLQFLHHRQNGELLEIATDRVDHMLKQDSCQPPPG